MPEGTRNTDDLVDYLGNLTPSDDAYVATRATLRVLPLIGRSKVIGLFQNKQIILLVFLNALAAWATRKYPELAGVDVSDVNTALSDLNDELSLGATEPEIVATADAAATIGNLVGDAGYNVDAVLSAIEAAILAASEVGGRQDVFASTDEDLWRANKRSSGEFLLSEPLWVFQGTRSFEGGRNAPAWFLRELPKFVDRLLSFDVNWGIWVEWYLSIIEGRELPILTEQRLLEILERYPEYYEEEPDQVCEEISDLCGRHYATKTSLSDRLSSETAALLFGVAQDQSVATFSVRGDSLQLRTVSETDEHVAFDPVTRQLHDASKRLLRDFKETAYSINNIHDWRGFAQTYDGLVECVDRDTPQLVDRVGEFWAHLCEMGTWIERDDDIRLQKATGTVLDSAIRRQLDAIIKISAPLLRRFPSGLALDDEMAAFSTPQQRYGATAELIRASGRERLLAEHDRQTLESFLAAVERGEFQGIKLKGYVTKTGKNLAIQACGLLAGIYLGAVGNIVGEESLVVQRAGKALLAAENAVVELFADSPADIRQAVRTLLEDLKKNPPAPLQNHDLTSDRYRREEDEEDEE